MELPTNSKDTDDKQQSLGSNKMRTDVEYYNKMPFHVLAKLCSKMINAKTKAKRCEILTNFLQFHRNNCPHGDIYPVLRLLLPNFDRARGPYGLKEFNLAKTYIRILCLPKDGDAATKLLNFRTPTSSRSTDTVGDFAEVAYWLFRDKCGASSKLTVRAINDFLDQIAEKHSNREPRAIDDIVCELFSKTDAEEQVWVVRLLLKYMHLGLGLETMLKIFHESAVDVFNVSNSLRNVSDLIKDRVRVQTPNIEMFRSFRPMLSERCVVRNMNFEGPHYVESKLDGERFQIHYGDGHFKYFSRNGYNYTETYGENEYAGNFSKLIKKQLRTDVSSFIMDGEMVCWDTKRKRIVNKGADVDVKKLGLGNVIQPLFFVFDLILLNEMILTNKPLSQRISLLETSFVPAPGVMEMVPRKIVSSNNEILEALNNAIDKCEEGIIVKKMNSTYVPNGRKGGWYKIKPEYNEGGLVDLDLLIIGGYYGDGKRKGMVSQFLLGLAVPGSNPPCFESVSRVGSGYSMQELDDLCSKLSSKWKKFRPNQPPPNILLSKMKPDLWISPEDSFVLQVKASEVVRSDQFYCGYTLRFVRVQKVRYDKPWDNTLTTKEFLAIRSQYEGKLTSGHISFDGSEKTKITRKRKYQDEEENATCCKSSRDIEKRSEILQGKEFFVISGDRTHTKDDLEKIIIENGGMVSPIAGSTVHCIIAGDVNVRVRNICKAKKHVVISYRWLLQCITAGEMIPWSQEMLLSYTRRAVAPKIKAAEVCENLEDKDLEPSNSENIKEILERMSSCLSIELHEMDELDRLMFPSLGSSPFSLFRGLSAFFVRSDEGHILDADLLLAEKVFEFFGGIVRRTCTTNPSDFVFSHHGVTDLEKKLEFISKTCKFHDQATDLNWIFDCMNRETRIDRSKYYPINQQN